MAQRLNLHSLQLFQSLFCWITHFGRHIAACERLVSLGFQSLFCWITHFGRQRQSVRDDDRRVSILVLLDHPLRHSLTVRSLSLRLRFNPCSAGSPTSALNVDTGPWFCWLLFQSLFCWITHFGREAVPDLVPPRPVSILVLLDHPLRPLDRIRPSASNPRFQSLFCWITHFGHVQHVADVEAGPVSILVLLDHPLRPRRRRQRVLQCWRV